MEGTHCFNKKLKKCGGIDNEFTTKFFKMFFDIRPEREEIFNLENEKTHDFWRTCFSPKLPKEKFDTLCNDSIDKTEIENSLSNDFNDFISGITPFIGKNYFNSMKNITFCRICSIEINKTLLYEHINSKEHKETEDYLIVVGMTYCELCKREIRNDKWREHITSQKHLNFEEKIYCEVCNMKYESKYDPKSHKPDYKSFYHKNSSIHEETQERLEFHAN